jgi:membrane protease YdiL (CAAX protease family)
VILADSLTHIAAAATAISATGPSGSGSAEEMHELLILLAVSLPGMVLAAAGGWRPRRVVGPDRASAFQSPAQLAAVLFFAGFSYLLAALAYSTGAHPHATAPAAPTEIDLSVLATVPPLVGVIVLFACDWAFGGRSGLERLGEDPLQIPHGLMFGIIGAIIAIPLVIWSEVATEAVYEHWHYIHPMEHELLPAMTEGSRWARIAIFIGAVAIAPLAEETFFRGHLQTLLRSVFIRISSRLRESPEAPPRGVRPWHSWLAIIITSALFARMHATWMMPPIFILSLCLGYAYERTGLLWTTITMHALFNGIETFLYFHQLH